MTGGIAPCQRTAMVARWGPQTRPRGMRSASTCRKHKTTSVAGASCWSGRRLQCPQCLSRQACRASHRSKLQHVGDSLTSPQPGRGPASKQINAWQARNMPQRHCRCGTLESRQRFGLSGWRRRARLLSARTIRRCFSGSICCINVLPAAPALQLSKGEREGRGDA